MSAVKKKAIF